MRTLLGLSLPLVVLCLLHFPCTSSPASPARRSAPRLSASHTEVPFLRPRPERIFSPAGVVSHRNGSIYILDSRAGMVKRFSRKGKCVQAFRVAAPDPEEKRHWVQSLVENADGSLLVMDSEEGVVRRFEPTEKLLATIRVSGKKKEAFPSDRIATDRHGNIYLVEQGELGEDPVLKKFSANGNSLWQHRLEKGKRSRYAGDVGALQIDTQGRVWLQGWDAEASTRWCRVFTFNSKGKVSAAETKVEYLDSHGEIVATASDGKGNRYELWFEGGAGYGTDLIKFNAKGKEVWICHWDAAEGTGLAIGRGGEVFVTLQDFKFTAPVCVEVSAKGKPVRAIGSNGTALGEIRDPAGIAIDQAGNLYVTDYYNYRIQKFMAGGAFVKKILGPTFPADTPHSRYIEDFLYPHSIFLDRKGLLYVSHRLDQTISIFSSGGKPIRTYPKLSLGYAGSVGMGHFGICPPYPAAVAVDSRGYIWSAIVQEPEYVETAKTRKSKFINKGIKVCKINHGGKILFSFGKYGKRPGEFGQPKVEGIGTAMLAVDGQDNAWVVDPGNNRAQKFSRTGEYLAQIGRKEGTFTGFQLPWGVAIDKQGRIYVGDSTRICRFDAGGRFLGVAAYLSDKPPVLEDIESWPYRGLAVDARGNIYITDASSDSVRKFVPRRPSNKN